MADFCILHSLHVARNQGRSEISFRPLETLVFFIYLTGSYVRRKGVKSAGKVDDSRVTRNRFFSVCIQKRVCFGRNRVGLIFLYCHGKCKMFNFVQKNPGFRIICLYLIFDLKVVRIWKTMRFNS